MSALMLPPNIHKQAGFTLLELVLVMFIIALIASTPLLFIDEQDQQLRYEETQKKMTLIRDAIYQQQSYRNQPLLSGFVIDNGALPPITNGVAPLLNQSDDYDSNGSNEDWRVHSQWIPGDYYAPHFNVAGASGDLSDSFAMRKGYFGPYITRELDSNLELRDGWGNDFDVSITDNTYTIDSSNAVATLTQSINAHDWLVPLTELDIEIVNDASMATAIEPVALLVFTNESDVDSNPDSAWTTYSFTPSFASAATATYSPSASDWFKNDDALSLSASEAHATLIPAGKHLLIYDPKNAVSGSHPHAFFSVFPAAIQPTVRLRIP